MVPDRRRRGRRAALVLLILLLAFPGLAPPAHAASDVDLAARISDTPVERTSNSRPLVLSPERRVEMVVTVTNRRSATIDVRDVRVEGTVVALTFFRYDTLVAMPVAPGQTETRHILLDLRGLEKQATGLMAGSVSVLDDDRNLIVREPMVVDVKGSMWSLYGLFGLTLVVLTAAAFLGALVALARGRLPSNRWKRGLRFAPIGIGLGLVVVFTLSIFRIWAPRGLGVFAVLGVLTAIAFVAGYLTPTPDAPEPPPPSPDLLIPQATYPPPEAVS